MKNVVRGIAIIIVVCLLVLWGIYNSKTAPISIVVREINSTPAANLGAKKEPNSILYQAYQIGKNKKWIMEFRYVYVLPEGSGFEWNKYLKVHPENGVDGGLDCHVIFSNQLPLSTENYFFVKDIILAKK